MHIYISTMKVLKRLGTYFLRKMKKTNFHRGAMAMTGFKLLKFTKLSTVYNIVKIKYVLTGK